MRLKGDPLYAFFEQSHVEIHEQSKSDAGEFQVGQQLGLEKWDHLFNRFQFDYDFFIHQ